LNGVEIGAALQQSTAGFAPQIVHIQIQFRKLLAAARKESAVVSPVRSVADHAESKRRLCLLVVLQAFAEFVAEHIRIGSELLAVRIVAS
jgi:hypothetical protein